MTSRVFAPLRPADPNVEPRLSRDFSQSLPMALLRAREAVMARIRPILRAHGVTEQQWRVLRSLSGAEPVDATQLARMVFLLRPSLTRILRDLQLRGLVTRASSASGLRGSLISITLKGRALIDETAPEAAEAIAEITAIYGVDNIETLRRNLLALEGLLQTERP